MTDQEFSQLASYVKSHYGIYLKEEKRAMVEGRLHNLLMRHGASSFTDYFNHVLSDKSGEAVAALVNKLTTNHTYFMREADHFYFSGSHPARAEAKGPEQGSANLECRMFHRRGAIHPRFLYR